MKETQRKARLKEARRWDDRSAGMDRTIGGVHAHQVKSEDSGDPWIATRIAVGIEELGYGG